jgi:hypothetical protein
MRRMKSTILNVCKKFTKSNVRVSLREFIFLNYFINQSTFRPKPLKVGAVYESVIHDNLDIFRANGFDFIFDENGKIIFAHLI